MHNSLIMNGIIGAPLEPSVQTLFKMIWLGWCLKYEPCGCVIPTRCQHLYFPSCLLTALSSQSQMTHSFCQFWYTKLIVHEELWHSHFVSYGILKLIMSSMKNYDTLIWSVMVYLSYYTRVGMSLSQWCQVYIQNLDTLVQTATRPLSEWLKPYKYLLCFVPLFFLLLF